MFDTICLGCVTNCVKGVLVSCIHDTASKIQYNILYRFISVKYHMLETKNSGKYVFFAMKYSRVSTNFHFDFFRNSTLVLQ